jgi:hypothetical protein
VDSCKNDTCISKYNLQVEITTLRLTAVH